MGKVRRGFSVWFNKTFLKLFQQGVKAMRGEPEYLREEDSGNWKCPEAGVCGRIAGTARRPVWLEQVRKKAEGRRWGTYWDTKKTLELLL